MKCTIFSILQLFVLHNFDSKLLKTSFLLKIQGGRIPQVGKDCKTLEDYYKHFDIDYGYDISKWQAGKVDTLLKTDTLANVQEKNHLFRWMNLDLVGKGTPPGRIKPFYVITLFMQDCNII